MASCSACQFLGQFVPAELFLGAVGLDARHRAPVVDRAGRARRDAGHAQVALVGIDDVVAIVVRDGLHRARGLAGVAADADLRVDQVLLDDSGFGSSIHRRHPKRMYSKSAGCRLMPIAGGAIQLAKRPGSTTRPINEATKARSAALGSHWSTCAAHSTSPTTRPSGETFTRRQRTDVAVEGLVRHAQSRGDAGLGDDLVPALDAGHRILDEVVAQHLVERVQHRHVLLDELAILDLQHLVGLPAQLVVVVALAFFVAAFQARAVEGGGVARLVGAEQVDGHAVVEVQVALDGAQIDDAGRAQARRVVGLQLVHRRAGARDDTRDAALADEHVVRLLGEHEARGARQRVERAFGECIELELAVAVGEVGEHEEAQPVRRRFVEGAEDARVVLVAGAAHQHRIGLLAAVAAEVLVQQIDHRPQVAAFFDVDLVQVAQVVLARRGQPQVALLFHRGRLGVALRDDDAAQVGAVLAGHLAPRRLALVVTEVDRAIGIARVQEDAPAIVLHLHVAELRPALRIDADRGAQVDLVIGRALGADIAPPIEEIGLPLLQRALQGAVVGEVDVVGDLLCVVDAAHAFAPWCVRRGRKGVVGCARVRRIRRDSSRTAPCRPCRRPSTRPCRRPHWGAGRSSSARR